MYYLFQLGRQPDISAAELEAVFYSLKHENIKTSKQKTDNYLIINFETEINAQELINQLGGTIKIAEDTKYEKHEITKYLQTTHQNGKIEFSLNDPELAINIKKELKALGRSVRYIELKNTATILHNKLVEKKSDMTIVNNQLFYTVAIQPFEEMAERDYGRPGADGKSGMLPPKLAKIMINLAVCPLLTKEGWLRAQRGDGVVIMDPFCGSGTILTEAASMGYKNLIGSDISAKAIADTEKNLKWVTNKYQILNTKYQILISDASKLSAVIKPSSIDAIITEPYLGKPLHGNETENFIKKQTDELKKLYLNVFKEFHKILKPNGVVVFIMPKFQLSFLRKQESRNHKEEWLTIDCTNDIEKIGFKIVPFAVETQNFASLQYHRPNQHLAREIWRFKKILSM